ncbi:hypothetical protein F2Q70_00014551 [Brassica cretica]|uniref:Uncharacterized protein n=1 Tax=Brassica cretica TaxID=69181 RepID=A0A8S9HQ46_BRACR|nr:hypothetical protein F2Q70_00014551 [Brassica cretica]
MTFKLKKNQAEEEEIHGSLSTPKIVRYYVNQAHTKHVDEECKICSSSKWLVESVFNVVKGKGKTDL